MADKNKRNLSLTDLDFHMDLDIENENRDRENKEKLESDKKAKIGNTLDYYRDEMATKEVEKMLQNIKHTQDEVKTEEKIIEGSDIEEDYIEEYIEEEQTEEDVKTTTSQLSSDTGSLDYQSLLESLRVTKKTEAPSPEPPERSEHKHSSRASRRREEDLRAFKTFRIAAFVIFALFLIGFAALAFHTSNISKEMAVFKADNEKLKEDNANYEELKIAEDALKIENTELENENAELRELIAQNLGDTTDTQGTETAADGGNETLPEETWPKSYTVKSGDSLWEISESFYGDGSLYTQIMAANNIVNESGIYSGMNITIPKV